jgi:serine/threonine protein phosphatase PrpC
MGSGASRLLTACACSRPPPASVDAEPCLDDALGHSFCYASAPATAYSSSSFRHGISGAALSANSSVPVPLYLSSSTTTTNPMQPPPPNYSSAFHTSSSFSSAPLQLSNLSSGPLFLSGPIDRGAQLSGPLDAAAVPFSGPLPNKPTKRASASSRGLSRRFRKPLFGSLRRTASEKHRPPITLPLPTDNDGVQWAHGRAGEDRVHVVVSEDQRWLFVGIYDGFNGPEAPDFLVANLYRFLLRELRGIFYQEADRDSKRLWQFLADGDDDDCELDFSGSGRFALSLAKLKERRFNMWAHAAAVGDDEISREWAPKKLAAAPVVRDHGAVLGALTRALDAAEAAYLDMTDQSMGSHPELAVTGACLLVALVRDDDVYVMNLGDSRAVVAQRTDEDDIGVGFEIEARSGGCAMMGLEALQLSVDHSTSIEEVTFVLTLLILYFLRKHIC